MLRWRPRRPLPPPAPPAPAELSAPPPPPPARRTPVERIDAALRVTASWTLRLLVVVAGAALVCWGLAQLWFITLPVLLGLLLSTVLRPPTRLLGRVLPDVLAALLSVLGLLAVVAGVVRFLAPRVRDQAVDLLAEVDLSLAGWQRALARSPIELPPGVPDDVLEEGIERLRQNSGEITEMVLSGALSGFVGIGSLLVTAGLTLVLAFFFVKDGARFLPWAHRWVGGRALGHVDGLGARVWTTLSGFIWAQAAVSMVDAVFIGLGLWLLDVPFALTLSVLIFFAGFIPIVGAVSTGVLAVLVALFSQGVWIGVAVLVLVVVVQQLESNILQPVLVGRVLSLHPAVVLSAVMAGSALAGVVGAFLAVPVVSVAVVALRYLHEVVAPEDAEPAATTPG